MFSGMSSLGCPFRVAHYCVCRAIYLEENVLWHVLAGLPFSSGTLLRVQGNLLGGKCSLACPRWVALFEWHIIACAGQSTWRKMFSGMSSLGCPFRVAHYCVCRAIYLE